MIQEFMLCRFDVGIGQSRGVALGWCVFFVVLFCKTFFSRNTHSAPTHTMGNKHTALAPSDPSTGLVHDRADKHASEDDLVFLKLRFRALDVDRVMKSIEAAGIAEIIESTAALRAALTEIKFFESSWFDHVVRHMEMFAKLSPNRLKIVKREILNNKECMDLAAEVLFELFDQNSSGVIGRRELAYGVLSFVQDSEAELHRLTFAVADKDNSQSLSREEVLEFILSQMNRAFELTRAILIAVFNAAVEEAGVDRHHPVASKALTQLTDLAEAFVSDCKLSLLAHKDELLQRYMDLNDVNRDGQIAFEEFQHGCESKQVIKLQEFSNNILEAKSKKLESDMHNLMKQAARDVKKTSFSVRVIELSKS